MAGFVQIIEYQTSKIDEIVSLVDKLMEENGDRSTVLRGTLVAVRDRPGSYMSIVEFASYEDAMKNSELPGTKRMAEEMAKLVDGPPRFTNLDVVRSDVAHGGT